jgi:hypothetical protein
MMKTYLIVVMGFMLTNIFCVSNDYSQQESPDVEIQTQELLNAEIRRDSIIEQEATHDIFIEAEKVTGCSAEILRGIAGAESHFTVTAVGDKGQSHGMFQLHSRWHDSRVEKYGDFDPFDPADAAIIAGYIIQENLRLFGGDLRKAIAAYRQGVTGVNQNGITSWYVDDVLFWQKDQKKVLAFFVFRGITELGRMENECIDFGTQIAYQPDDTTAVQISWRGSSSFSY